MYFARESNLKAQTSTTRRVTLTSNVFTDAIAGPSAWGVDTNGFTFPINCSKLPAGVHPDMVRQGDVWIIDNFTTSYTLTKQVSSNPGYMLVPNPQNQTPGQSLTVDPNTSIGMSWRQPQIATFSFPGIVTSSTSTSYMPLSTIPLNIQTVGIAVSGKDTQNKSITVNFLLNGSSLFTETFPTETLSSIYSTTQRTFGNLTDTLYVTTTYTGSSASNLSVSILLT